MIVEVSPDVYQLASLFASAVLIGEDNSSLLDMGSRGSTGQLLKLVRRLYRSPRDIQSIVICIIT
jgi:hypothetical protein